VGSAALHVRLIRPEQRPAAAEVLSRVLGAVTLEPDPARISVACADALRAAEAVAELARSGVSIADFALGQPSLDEVFLALTGHPADDDGGDAARRPAHEGPVV
jgi:ABC-2 type transport system ATP-binding protein